MKNFPAPRALIGALLGSMLWSPPASAQSPTRYTIVALADSFTVSVFIGAREGSVITHTPNGVFRLRADSSALVAFANATAALPPPKPSTSGAQSGLAGTVLGASDESGNAIRILRVSDDTLPIYNVRVTNGAWEFARRISPESGRALLTALRGGSRQGVEWKVAKVAADSSDRVFRPADIAPDSPHPTYPLKAELGGLSGEVQAQFKIGADGRARPASLLILKSTHPLFALAVREVLPRMRFLPATQNGVPIAQEVVQTFQFRQR